MYTIDPVKQLFLDLPRPEEYEAELTDADELDRVCYKALVTFLQRSQIHGSLHPEFRKICKITYRAAVLKYFNYFDEQLGGLAFIQPEVLRGDGTTQNYFRYCHWKLLGRKNRVDASLPDGRDQLMSPWKAASTEERRLVKRALSIFYLVAVSFMAATYPHEILSIRETPDMVIATQGEWRSGPGDLRCFSDTFSRVAIAGLSKSAKKAMVTYGRCVDVLTVLKPLFDLLLGPFFEGVEEVEFVPKAIDRPVKIIWPHDTIYNSYRTHLVVRATTHSGHRVAIDPTGSQFGWSEVITP
ncbi:hypothetical protein TruAng_006385 [Truncatella angustata]|nr:hypothetical protein TruAng_006385 [Truncatella angustata]